MIDDISELKKAEAELRENNLFFDSIIENIPDMIFLKEAESLRFIKFNKSGEELLGYSRGDLLSKNDYDFFPKEEADFFTTKDREVLESGIVLEIEEEPIHTKNKGMRILHTKKIAIKDQDDNSKFLLGISEDITERKRLEEIKRIRDLAFESSTNGILVTGTANDDYAIIHCNPAFLKMTGYTREEVLGKNCRFLQAKDRNQEALTELRTALIEGKSFKGILRNYKKDGTLFWNELIVAPVIDDSGSLTHLVGILNDITERKKAEDKLQKTYSELEIKVEERTAELLKLNQKLKSEIEVRASAEEALKLNVEQLSRKNRYEEIISTVTRVVHQSLDLNELLENAVDVISKNVDNADFVITYFIEGDTAVLKTHRGLSEEYINKASRVPRGKGAVWHTILEGKSRYVPDVDEDKIIGDAGKKLGHKSYLAVPLYSSNNTVGLFGIASTEKHCFDDEEIRLLEIVSQQIGVAINNAKQAEALKENLEQLSRKNRYEEIVSSVTQSVNQSTELQEVLDKAVKAMCSNIEVADHVAVLLVEGEHAVMKSSIGYTDEFVEKVKKIPYPKGFTWATINKGEIIYCPDTDNDNTIGPAGKEVGTKSHLSIPLRSEEKTIGVINLNSQVKNAFREDDINLLEVVGKQIEIAINKSWDAEALRLNVEQLSRKNRYEEIISTVTRVVHQSLDLNEVLGNAVDAMCSNIGVADHVGIYLLDGEVAVMKANRGYPDWFCERVMRIPKPRGFTWACINEGKVLHCPDTENDDVIGPAGKEVGTKSYVAIPLNARGETIGSINLHSLNKNAFDNDDINLLEVVGKQIEIAINKSRDAEALRNSEERYRTLYQENPSMYFTINEDGNVLSVNRHGVEQLGYKEEELIGQPVFSVFHEEDKAKIRKQLSKCFANPDQIFRWELRKLHKNGSVISVNELARCVIDAGGNKVALVACEDITERKKAEDEKREAEERYRTIVENTYNLIIETDILGNISYANPRHKEILGYDPEEMIGTNCLDLIYEDDRMNIAAAFQKAASTGESVQTARYRCKHKDGELRWLESTGRSYRDAKGEIRGVISSRDITDRKMAEDRRKEVEERNRALIEHAYDIIVETTADGSFSYLNPTFKETLGYDTEEVLGKNIFEYVHDDDRAQVMWEFTRALNSFTTGNTSYRFRHKNGDWRWLESSGRPYRTASGEIRASITTRDITERKKAEEALRDSEERHRALIENTYDLIIEISPDLKYLYVSPNHQSVLGYEQQDLVGKSIFENMHPDDSQEVLSSFQKIALNIINLLGLNVDDIFKDYVFSEVYPEETRELWGQMESAIEKYLESEHSLIFRFKSKKGIWTWLESTGRPFWTSSGELRIVVSSRDITERKLSEDQLQKAFSEIEKLKDQLEQENIYLQEEVKLKYHYGEIYGESEVLKSALRLAEQVANTESTVLILGDTGTGKELLAHAIHNMSPRRKRPMITVNCANLPASLVETELFGHEKGAFTGATSQRAGRFEVADGSTIFLDEVGELPLELQSKLLRVLQTGQFERIGGSSTISVNARVIAATNRDMLQAVEDGGFRQDLYYRLNVFPISLPPLRERQGDIKILVEAFVKEFSEKMGKKIDKIPKKIMNSVLNYRWPGNIRELRNVIERAVIISRDDKLSIDLPGVEIQPADKAKSLDDLEKNHIVEILNTTNWRIRGKAGAAELLDMKPTTLESKMRKLGIERYKLDS